MKKGIIIALFLVMILSIRVMAQTEPEISKAATIRQFSLNASYYGNTIWYPGGKFGAEYVFHESQKSKVKENKKNGEFTKIKFNQFIVTGNVGFFWHPNNYFSMFTNYAVIYRRTSHKGFQFSTGLSPVGLNVFFFNETYEVSDTGDVKKAALPTRFFYSPSVIIGIGHTKDKKVTAWFLDLHIVGLVPYNTGINAYIGLEYGYRFNLKK